MDTGKAIRELRKSKGLSQEELAGKAKITQTTLSQIENGKRPGVKTMANLCKALQVPEALLHIMAMEKKDVPAKNKDLFDSLFPLIQSLVVQVAEGKKG